MAFQNTGKIPFAEWMPDKGEIDNPGTLVALNCLTQGEKYKPFYEALENSDALPDKPKGRYAYIDGDGNVTIFAATATNIYKLNGTSWDVVTRDDGMGGYEEYSTGTDGSWFFGAYGQLVIATNYVDDVQVFNMASSSQFDQLSATAPRCRSFFFLKDFMVMLDVVDGDGSKPGRARWSPFADPTGDWTQDPTGTRADFQDLTEGKCIFGAAIDDYGVIITTTGLKRMSYSGGATIFTIDPIDAGRGSLLLNSCIGNGRSIFFRSQDGFYEFSGSDLIPILYDKADEYVSNIFDESYDYNISSAIDPINKNVLWSFASKDADAGQPDKILVFNWQNRRSVLIEHETPLLFSFFSVGYTLEQLDAFGTLDTLSYSLDSRIWTGGKTVLGCFSVNNKLGAFAGSPKTAIIGTGEVKPNDMGRTIMHNLTPYVKGGTKRVRIGHRQLFDQPVTWTVWQSLNPFTGKADFGIDSNLFRAQVEISGDWELASCFSYEADPSGEA